MAKKYFGNLWNASIGETIQLNNETDFLLSGIFADVPANSSMQFDYIIPFKKILADNPKLTGNYGDYNFLTYALLEPTANTNGLGDQLLSQLFNKLTDSFKPCSM